MSTHDFTPQTAIVIGASGQDGYFLTERLLAERWRVHATARQPDALRTLAALPASADNLHLHSFDLIEPSALFELIARTRPEEIYNLAGQSSVSRSFAEPFKTWRTNADFVVGLLEHLRLHSPATRFYQASSTDMFGGIAGGTARYDEDARLNPQSPYASAKAAAHLLCHFYRQAYNLRIGCGILSNHESHRRPAQFLSRKITDHVAALRRLPRAELEKSPPLTMGNLKIRRDWGFAPDYVEGMRLILRQISVRSARRNETTQTAHESGDATTLAPLVDEGRAYRDYVLGTGETHAVWELVDAAFRLAGFALEWQLEGEEPSRWLARFRTSGGVAVVVDEKLLRPSDPLVIQVDPTRARAELGWSPRAGLEVFLRDMLGETTVRAAHGEQD
ncbi:MAG TPA: GDP-mannose 4,6-dehydratase [Pyrinomonadaceae bacterium]|jgi:GDPmannose 4,6-dehydratase|nr:GDP-mannose 4,6-dehydratase [Pyrinomonadaceae bacterium]